MDRTSLVSREAASAAAVGVGALLAVWLPGGWPLVPGLVLLGIAWRIDTAGADEDVSLAGLCWGAVAVAMALSFGLIWPIPPLIGLGVAAGLWLATGPRPLIGWLGPGVTDRPAQLLATITVPVTAMSLVLFIASGRTDIETATEGLHGLPVWLVVLAGVGFVVVNPAVEEVLFRGVLQNAVVSATGSVALAVITQGLIFGAIHRNGVPGGPLGMAMAGAWGVALGIIRHRTTSIRVPWLVHVVANIAIFLSVAILGYREGVL